MKTAHDTEATNLALLEKQVARLSLRVDESRIAKLDSPVNIPPGDVVQRQSSQRSSRPRRKSSVVEELARQVQQLTDSLAEKDEAMEELNKSSRELRNKSVVFMLTLSYADLISDLVLAVVLLHGSQASYGVAALTILGVSLVVQVLAVKFYGRKPWLSKDTLFTAICLGPALEAYRQFAGEPARARGAPSATEILGALKAIEVAIETLPAVVLQLTLLISSPNNWTSPELLISLSISITAAAVLMVDAESGTNGVADVRRRNIEYYGYLPLKGVRRAVLLVSLTFFMAGYLPKAGDRDGQPT
jgi:hypothetical protein